MITGTNVLNVNNEKLLNIKAYIDEALYKSNLSFEISKSTDENGNDFYGYTVEPGKHGLISWSPKQDTFVGFFVDWPKENWYVKEGFTTEFIETGAAIWITKNSPDDFLKSLIVNE